MDIDKEQIVREFAEVINRHSLENETDTPDFILAEYLFRCLDNYTRLHHARKNWYIGVKNREKTIPLHRRRSSSSLLPVETEVR